MYNIEYKLWSIKENYKFKKYYMKKKIFNHIND